MCAAAVYFRLSVILVLGTVDADITPPPFFCCELRRIKGSLGPGVGHKILVHASHTARNPVLISAVVFNFIVHGDLGRVVSEPNARSGL